MNKIVTAIDMNSSGISLVTGYVFQDKVYALFTKTVSPIKLNEEHNLDKEGATETLLSLIKEAEEAIHRPLRDFICLFPPDEFQYKVGNSTTFTSSESDTITFKDYQNCINMINKQYKIDGEAIVYNDPVYFQCDSTGKTYDFPLYKKSDSLYTETAIHMISKNTYEHYRSILREAGVNPYLCLVSTFASSYFLAFFKAPQMFIQLQIENDFVYLTLTRDKHLLASKMYPLGLNHVYLQASNQLKVDMNRAIELGKIFGLKDDAGFPFVTNENLSLKTVSQAFKEGFNAILPSREEVNTIASNITVPIILLGPGKKFEGLEKHVYEIYQRSTMTFSPKVIGARDDSLIASLGGIRMTENAFLEPLKETRKSENESSFTRSSFTRG